MIMRGSDVQITSIGASGAPAVPTRALLYTATVSNKSQRAIDGVTLLMRVPPELTFHYQQDADPDPVACYDATCSGAEEAHFTLGSLPAGTTTTVVINPIVVAAAAGDGTLITPVFTLQATDRNPIHRLITHPAKSRPDAQLALVTDTEPVLAGQPFTLRLKVGQIGAAPLSSTALELRLPPELAAGAVSDGGSASGGVVTWNLGSIPVAGGAERTVVVTVDDDVIAGTTLQARAALAYAGGDELDATDAISVSVVAAPLLLGVTVDALVDPVILGQPVLYTTTITNNSARAVENVSLLMRLPFGVQFHYTADADPDSAPCYDALCAANEEAFWTIPSLAAGASQAVTVNATTALTLTGGSLITVRQRVTATDLGGRINLNTTIGTESP
jgi:uncharacterized repeat protein (TIGR01451 family)